MPARRGGVLPDGVRRRRGFLASFYLASDGAGHGNAMRAAAETRITDGFSTAFGVIAAFAGLNALPAWTLPLRRL